MRWVTYHSPAVEHDRVGLLLDDEVHGSDRDVTLRDLLEQDGLAQVAAEINRRPAEVLGVEDVTLRSPVPIPPSVRDFMAFEEHVSNSMAALGREVNPVWYEIPVFYFTNPAAVRGPTDPVEISPGSEEFDYELEVGVVIGRTGRDIRLEDAEQHIAGYTIFCDWSARDLQRHEMEQGLGPAKGKDGATTLGPWLVTPDELEDVRRDRGFDLQMSASVNGQVYSRGNLADLHWSFSEMIAYASRGTVVRAGDVLGSGTVGTGCILELSLVHGPSAYPYLVPGDVVTLEVERLGRIESRIRAYPEEGGAP